MDVQGRYGRNLLLLGVLAFAHALLTWPVQRALALFVGGAAIAFAAEVAVGQAGLVEHRLEPQVLGVPAVVVLAWPATVYVALRLVATVVPLGLGAAVLTAVLATLVDAWADPRGVADRVWRYPRVPVSRRRYRDVPYWNFAGWLVVAFLIAALAAFA